MRYEYVRIRGGGDGELSRTLRELGDEGVDVVQITGDHRPGDRFFAWEVFARRAISPSEQSDVERRVREDYGYGPNSVDPADRQEIEAERCETTSDAQLIYESEQVMRIAWRDLCELRDRARGAGDRVVATSISNITGPVAAMITKLEKRRTGA